MKVKVSREPQGTGCRGEEVSESEYGGLSERKERGPNKARKTLHPKPRETGKDVRNQDAGRVLDDAKT